MSYYNKIYGLLLEKGKKPRSKSTGSPTGSTGPTGAPTGSTGAPTGPTGAPPPPDEEARKEAARNQYKARLNKLSGKLGARGESPMEYSNRMRDNYAKWQLRQRIVNPDTGVAPNPTPRPKPTAFDRFDTKLGQVMQSGKDAVADKIRAAKDRVIGLIKKKP
jgi:hypothetical protein